jgi:hypothetical protein
LLAAREGELENAQHMVHELEDAVGELRELELSK